MNKQIKMGNNILVNDDTLVKYLCGMATAEERKTVLDWIHENPEHESYFKQLRDIYEAAKVTQSYPKEQVLISWERVKAKHYQSSISDQIPERKTFSIKILLKYAAIVTIVSMLSVFVFQKTHDRSKNKLLTWNLIEAPLGSRSVVTLSDGSRIWLNAGSKLSYPATFAQDTREVFLSGEAYFVVNKQAKRKFVVKTSHVKIIVTGTEFNVKAYPEENTIQTTLVKGSIILEPISKNGKKNEIYLKPNQSATFIKNPKEVNELNNEELKKSKVVQTLEENILLMPKIDPVIYTSWKDDRWIIEGEKLSSLAAKLEKRFNVNITFDSESLKNYQFSGTLKDETLEQVLNLIKLSAPISYTINQHNVRIKSDTKFKKTYDELLIHN